MPYIVSVWTGERMHLPTRGHLRFCDAMREVQQWNDARHVELVSSYGRYVMSREPGDGQEFVVVKRKRQQELF